MYLTNIIIALLLLAPLASNPEELFREAVRAVERKDFDRALSKFEAALREDPDSLKYASEYRQTVIQAEAYDRCLAFFDELTKAHPESASAALNYGFAYVDKIPVSGSITQVIHANTALNHFTRSIELEPTWIGYYTRGNSYLFWPRIFNRTQLGIDDLRKALEIQKSQAKRPYHQRVYASLGDGYWKMDQLDRARDIWRDGLQHFPESAELRERLEANTEDLERIIGGSYDPNQRVNTDLREIWEDQ
jgi:tetratricopeptide (TPR) repeat protein